MRDIFLILALFGLGVLLGRMDVMPAALRDSRLALGALWVFMLLAGLSVGADRRLAAIIRTVRPHILFLPLATTIGTLGGTAAASLFLPLPAGDCLAVGAGFGYYSLSSIFITQYRGADVGTIALLANIMRELFAIVFMPLLAKFLGPLPAIASAGCASMDTCLPFIARYAGQAWIIPALLHGIVLDFTVPFWVMLFCSL